MYRCAKCNKPVMVLPTHIIRFCEHDKAVIIAELKASMEGRGGLR